MGCGGRSQRPRRAGVRFVHLPPYLGGARKGNCRLYRDEFAVDGRCIALARREEACRPRSTSESRIRAFAQSLGAPLLTPLFPHHSGRERRPETMKTWWDRLATCPTEFRRRLLWRNCKETCGC